MTPPRKESEAVPEEFATVEPLSKYDGRLVIKGRRFIVLNEREVLPWCHKEAKHINDEFRRAVKDAVERERGRCAKVVENNFTNEFISAGSIEDVPKNLAAAIRKGEENL